MLRHVGSPPHKHELELAGAVSNCVGWPNGTTNWWFLTLATVAPLHVGNANTIQLSHDVRKQKLPSLNIWDVLSKWKCPLISLQNPKIISCRLMYSNFIIFGVREWQQDFWPIAYNIAIFSVYSTSCVLPPAELNFTCGWSSYTWSGQLLRLK